MDSFGKLSERVIKILICRQNLYVIYKYNNIKVVFFESWCYRVSIFKCNDIYIECEEKILTFFYEINSITILYSYGYIFI